MFGFFSFVKIWERFQVYTNEVYEASAGHVEMHWLIKRPRFDPALPGARVIGRLAFVFILCAFAFCMLHSRFLVRILQRGTHMDWDKTDTVVYTDYLCNRCMNQVTWTQNHQGMRTRCSE